MLGLLFLAQLEVIKTSSYIIGDHVRAPRKASDQHGGETLVTSQILVVVLSNMVGVI